MFLLVLPVVLLLLALGARALGGVHVPSHGERIYVALSPLPLAVSLIVPAVVGLLGGFAGSSQQSWFRAATTAGLGLSLLLGAVGVGLVVRLVHRRARWGWPLGASVVLAAAPFALVAVSAGLLWLLGRVL